MTKDYYSRNKHQWKKGGKYYYYKSKETEGEFRVRKGTFLIYFD